MHELGHTLSGWSMGSPSIPRILPGVRADTIIGDRVLFLVVMLIAFEIHLLLEARRRELPKPVGVCLLVAIALQLTFTFTSLRMDFFLLAGHLGELAFAAICIYRCFTAVATHGKVERGLYATVGWYLFGSNLWLAGGLALSAEVRAWYAEGSPCGLRNDYVRIAETHGLRIESVGIAMCALTLLVLATSLWFARKH